MAWRSGSAARGAKCPSSIGSPRPAAFVTADDPPFFFFHGENDQLVPLMSPTEMRAELETAGVPVELYVVPKLGHLGCAMNREADRPRDRRSSTSI